MAVQKPRISPSGPLEIPSGGGSALVASADSTSVPQGVPTIVLEFDTLPDNDGGIVMFTLHGICGPVPGAVSDIDVSLIDAGGVKATLDRSSVANNAGDDNARFFAGDNATAFTLSEGLISLVTLVAPLQIQVTLTGLQSVEFDRSAAVFFPINL